MPADELWRTHERRRERLVAFARRRMRAQLLQRAAGRSELDAAEEALDPEALTIGFARRFASYKRATLLLRDSDRLLRLLTNTKRPLQIVYSGKAHPRDDFGKELIRKVVALARDERFRSRVVFLEDYDMMVARYLVQGCDVWLNTPRRPLEASGTSGMKALANGVLNVSTLDGWWDEAWTSTARLSEPPGWAIGKGEDYADEEVQDEVEAAALYDLLEREIVPLFYNRAKDGIPRRWVNRMKSSIRSLCPSFNMHRQIMEYTDAFYVRAHSRFGALTEGSADRSRALSAWIDRLRAVWSGILIESVDLPGEDLAVGTPIHATARIRLPQLTPADVEIELIAGRLDKDGELDETVSYSMAPVGQTGETWIFEWQGTCFPVSGLHGITVRVLPARSDLSAGSLPGLVAWADGAAGSASA